MFGEVDLRKNSDGGFEVFDHYCQEWKGEKEFRAVTNNPQDMPGPRHIVHVRLMNCEHSWPQSKFTAPKNSSENLVQKTDLHHIFSTDTKVNAERSNWEFAEVNRATAKAMACSDGRLGEAVALPKAEPLKGAKYFEPPTAFKGNVARALFYFSSRYNAGMSELQEAYLRKWNREDPPDEMEKARHEKVYRLSGLRNPFIDTPSLAVAVSRFCRLRLQPAQAATPFDCN
jgi:endonuclease I